MGFPSVQHTFRIGSAKSESLVYIYALPSDDLSFDIMTNAGIPNHRPTKKSIISILPAAESTLTALRSFFGGGSSFVSGLTSSSNL